MLPGHQRLQGLRDAARGGQLDPDPHAHRQGRRVGPGRGARHRRRRLPHQAVLLRRARRPAPRAAPPRRARAARPCSRSATSALDPAARAGLARRRRGRADRPRVRRCSSSCCATPGEVVSKRQILDARLGLRLRGRPEHRRGLRPPPAQQARPRPSGARRSRRSAARATGWRATVAEAARGPAPRCGVRTTAAAVLVVALALLVGRLRAVALVRDSLRDGLETAADQRASTLAARSRRSRPPGEPEPVDDGGRRRATTPDELVWQVTDAPGTVVRASQPLSRHAAHRGHRRGAGARRRPPPTSW